MIAVWSSRCSIVIGSPGQQRRAPAEARRERDLRALLRHQRVEDQLVEGAVEIAAPIQQRPRSRASCSASFACVRRAHPRDQRAHRPGRRAAGSRTPAAADSDSRPRCRRLHVEIEHAEELAVAAGVGDQRVPARIGDDRPAAARRRAYGRRVSRRSRSRATASFRSTSMPLCDSSTTTCAPLPRASSTDRLQARLPGCRRSSRGRSSAGWRSACTETPGR